MRLSGTKYPRKLWQELRISMKITVRFFAIVRDRIGMDRVELDLPEGSTISIARKELARRFESIAPLLPRAAMAVNREYVRDDFQMKDGDELAIIPPVSGG